MKFDALGENTAQKTLTFQWQKGALVQSLPTTDDGRDASALPEARMGGIGAVSGTALLQAIVDGILTGGVYALMAAGLTLIFGVMDIINIAQGAMVVLGAYLSYELSTHVGIGLLPGLLLTVPAMFVLGVAIEFLFMRRLRESDRTGMSILVTFAVAILIEGVLTALYGVDYVQLHASYVDKSVYVLGLLPAVDLPDRVRARGTAAGRPLLHAVPDQVRARGAGIAAEPHRGGPDRDQRQPDADDLGRDRRRGHRRRRDGVRRHDGVQPEQRL